MFLFKPSTFRSERQRPRSNRCFARPVVVRHATKIMHEDETEIHERLASHVENYEVRGKFHDMLTHVTYEVVVDGQ